MKMKPGPKPKNSEPIACRLDTGLIRHIEALASKSMRNRSNMIEFILVEYVRKNVDPNFHVQDGTDS